MTRRSPIFTHLAVSLPTPLPLHVQVQIHWTTTAVHPVCACVTKPTRAYATRGTNCCHLTDSTCVRPGLLSVFISSALPQVIIVAAGQRGNAPTVVVVASRAGLSPSSLATGRHGSPAPDPPLTIALCSGLLWSFLTSWSLAVSALLQSLSICF